jgi:hypothetical protein
VAFQEQVQVGPGQRIRTLLEMEAFTEIHKHWKSLGYPFGALVPSYATAIGASGDRPAALAELIGIILNGGVRLPTSRIEGLHFAAATPYETVVRRTAQQPERVMAPEVAAVLKRALVTWSKRHGTAPASAPSRCAKRAACDRRQDRHGRQPHRGIRLGGHLIQSRSVSRTATFAFFIGERYFGVITAYVPGESAQNYNFTSALPVQILKNLAPELSPYVDPSNARACGGSAATRVTADSAPSVAQGPAN